MRQDPAHWIPDLIQSTTSVLLIPPRLSQTELSISPPPGEGVYLGLLSSGTLSEHPNVHWILKEKLLLNAQLSAQAFDIQSDDRLMILASPWHVAGLSWALMGVQLGAQTQIYAPYASVVDTAVDRLSRQAYTHLFTTPSVLRRLLLQANWSVEEIICGGASFELQDFNNLSGHCSTLINAYGQTECGGLISLKRLAATAWQTEEQTLCVGRPPEAIRIRCKGNRDLPGPIYVHSPTALIEGWTDTGDFGYLDEQGDLFILKRKKDGIFTTGGK